MVSSTSIIIHTDDDGSVRTSDIYVTGGITSTAATRTRMEGGGLVRMADFPGPPASPRPISREPKP